MIFILKKYRNKFVCYFVFEIFNTQKRNNKDQKYIAFHSFPFLPEYILDNLIKSSYFPINYTSLQKKIDSCLVLLSNSFFRGVES